jgi:hypothetical protein
MWCDIIENIATIQRKYSNQSIKIMHGLDFIHQIYFHVNQI